MKHPRDYGMLQTPTTRRTKRSKNHDVSTSTTTLPDHMLVEIFARLPAKSVGRFRCLSRWWAATLTSASFIKLHLQQANEYDQPATTTSAVPPKLFFTTAQRRFHAWRSADGQVEQLTGVLPFPHLDEPKWPLQVLTKPCHGLVLLRRLPYYGHYVCNPSTGALLPLPDSGVPSTMRSKLCGCAPNSINNSASYGLGYSSRKNSSNDMEEQYKVVRLFSRYDGRDARVVSSCEVLSLDVSAHWRPAAQQPPLCTVRAAPAVFFNGYLHFLQDQEQGTDSCIVTFNVCSEMFGSLMPPSSGLKHDVPLELTVLDGSLSAHHHHGHLCSDVDPYCIWRLTDYGTGQWEKLYSIIQPQTWPKVNESGHLVLPSNWISPLAIYHEDNRRKKKIMFATGAGVLAVDLDGHGGVPEILVSPNKKIVDNNSSIKTIYPMTVGLLEESLVSVGRTSNDIIFSLPWSDVFKWLPAQSIVPLMRVCKDWRAVIKSDRFTQLHNEFHVNLRKSPKIMLLQPYLGMFYSLEFCRMVQREMGELLSGHGRPSVLCSKPCHGLIVGSCMNREEGTFHDFICNPSREYYKPILCLDDDIQDTGNSLLAGRIGLGYDSRIKKHVLVRLVLYHDKDAGRDYRLECYVQLTDSLYTDWTSITPPPKPVADMQPAYADGKLYWVVDSRLEDKSASRVELLALDVGTMEFEVLRGPPCNCEDITSIVESQGNICILCSEMSANTINVWKIEGASWSMVYHIELGEFRSMYSSEETKLLDVDPRDGRLLLSTGKALGYYDPKTRTLEAICCLAEHLQGMDYALVLCHESLIRPWSGVQSFVYGA